MDERLLTPDEARVLAQALNEAADKAERDGSGAVDVDEALAAMAEDALDSLASAIARRG
jgi:hypothetical protein